MNYGKGIRDLNKLEDNTLVVVRAYANKHDLFDTSSKIDKEDAKAWIREVRSARSGLSFEFTVIKNIPRNLQLK